MIYFKLHTRSRETCTIGIQKTKISRKFPCGAAGKGTSIATAVVWVQSLAWEFPLAQVKQKKKTKNPESSLTTRGSPLKEV